MKHLPIMPAEKFIKGSHHCDRFEEMRLIIHFGLVVSALSLIADLHGQTSTPPLVTLKAAAGSGDAQAQTKLGDVYGSQLDSINALNWYRRAATQGVAHAQSEAGRILIGFANSHTAKPEVKIEHGDEAIYWLVKSANQGDQAAQLELGKQYLSGKFIELNQVEAYTWLTLATRSGNPLVPKELEAKWARDALILKLTPEQIAEGQEGAAALGSGQSAMVDSPEPLWVKDIKLMGLSGSGQRRLAIINGWTFQKGEQAEIKASSKKVRIRCTDIGPESATIAIDGIARPKEIQLFPIQKMK